MFTVGDKKGKKASCFVEVNFEDPEDVADSEAWDVGDEMILFCGKAFDYRKSYCNFYLLIYIFRKQVGYLCGKFRILDRS